jgi:two-component system, response regulator YesN
VKDEKVSDRVLKHVMTVTDREFADLSVSVLAHLFKVERCKLSRQFKQQTDLTLEDFLFREKMSRAAFLLISRENITVKEVARRIGFCTCDYFIQKFRRYYGIVPGRYKAFKTSSLDNGVQ